MSDELRRFIIFSLVTGGTGLIWGDGERGLVLFGLLILVYFFPIMVITNAQFEVYGRP